MALNPDTIEERVGEIRRRIEEAIADAGRRPDDVLLVAVSKTFPADAIAGAIAAGVTDLGENRAQELIEKVSVLGSRAQWHFVGNLQTNKVRLVVGSVVLIHSVDRFGLAEAISRRAAEREVVQDVLIEVNVSGEGSKHGVEPTALMRLADEIRSLPALRLVGLMTMAPFSPDPDSSRPYYGSLRSFSEQLVRDHPGAVELSMGMSGDFPVAIEEGATIVRVGEAIFGPRRPPA